MIKKNLQLICIALSIFILGCTDKTIPYSVIKKSETRNIKISFDLEVPLIQGRLPTKKELGEISKAIVSKKHETSYVLFYLPGMKVDAGAFASAHHNPNMEVRIMSSMLNKYPQYKKLLIK